MNTLLKQVLPALCAALCVALLAGPVRAVISIDQASPKAQLPAGHPAIGPNSPMVNPQAIPLKMQTTAEIQSQDRTVVANGMQRLSCPAIQRFDFVLVVNGQQPKAGEINGLFKSGPIL